MTKPVVLGTLLLAVLPLIAGAAERDDSDGDGILDDHEAVLGTDPRKADPLQVVIDDRLESERRRAEPTYDPTKDVLRIEFGHVAEDRLEYGSGMKPGPVSQPVRVSRSHGRVEIDSGAVWPRAGRGPAARRRRQQLRQGFFDVLPDGAAGAGGLEGCGDLAGVKTAHRQHST